MWADRLSWSGELQAAFPELRPVAMVRFDDGYNSTWRDIIDPTRIWAVEAAEASAHRVENGRFGSHLVMNRVNPSREQALLKLPYFTGLWPSSGRLLTGMWVSQSYTMQFNPLISSRGGDGVPLAYLSSHTNGSLRHMVYDSAGSLVLDQYETPSWGESETRPMWVGQLVDLTARTSQLAAVNLSTHQAWLSPVRSLSGVPNASCRAPVEIAGLPHAEFWTGGEFDEVLVAHPTSKFVFADFVERLRLATWATASDSKNNSKLIVSDTDVSAQQATVFSTGAERVQWSTRPEPSVPATPFWSTDNGTSWNTGELPETFSGLLRWDVQLGGGQRFSGLELLPPAPVIAPIAQQVVPQQGTKQVQLRATAHGELTWEVSVTGLQASVVGAVLTLSTGWAAGEVPVTVTATDQWGRKATRTFIAVVTPPAWKAPTPPRYPKVPILLGIGDKQVAIIDALNATVMNELNGEETVTFQVPHRHRHAGLITPEAPVEVAGKRYRVRRVKTIRIGSVPVIEAYCEALFYDLAYARQIEAREFLQESAGNAMEVALAGTGWRIAAVNVSTRRTYQLEACTPLELLRTVQQQHGGDLLFDTKQKQVSLVSVSGRDSGVMFAYGKGLTESQRVVDTTSLVTRIYAQNADGVTIASVNNGKPYLEDYSFTDELREATYDFEAGVSPFTMLSVTRATLAARCKPSYSYEFTVADLSHLGHEIDRFDVGDRVTVVDDELDIRAAQRIVAVEHDIVRPWRSRITLSGKLRELGDDRGRTQGALSTGSTYRSFDLVPFNLLKNGRFDNALAHWASSGAELVEGSGTGKNAVRFQGEGTRWIEQTVHPDNRNEYALSMHTRVVGGGDIPPLRVIVSVEYTDGTRESIPVELT